MAVTLQNRSLAASRHPLVGCPIDELDTPALCIDFDAMQRNIRRVSETCRQHAVAWRPHAKGHKSPIIAHLQQQAGAIGVTCAKLGEAEVMCEAGITEILIANQLVGPTKLRRLTELCQHSRPIVCVDHMDQIVELDRAARAAGTRIRVLVEVDIGLNRAGIVPDRALELAAEIDRARGLELAGIMGYEGHLLALDDPAEKERLIREAIDQLVAVKDALLKSGLPCPIVSCGGTGSFATTVSCPGITEVQAGGLIFMDAFYRHACQVHNFEYALTVVTTVVSRPSQDRAIIDAGRKCLNGDLHTPLVLDADGQEQANVAVDRLSAEHGWLLLRPGVDLQIGDRLTLIPGYGDLTCVLHDEFYVVHNGLVEDVWPLAARGKLR